MLKSIICEGLSAVDVAVIVECETVVVDKDVEELEGGDERFRSSCRVVDRVMALACNVLIGSIVDGVYDRIRKG
ncbi:unnamed protein product [Didymodactylos carnosus]|uniref:Uncharacterized protein n=1 Tax=Didymodactylos carnosus TaxID=1234261 RepID=A0A8S2YSS1_9BILA|nr:unnamed protein product [Didymodactylos carnosus]